MYNKIQTILFLDYRLHTSGNNIVLSKTWNIKKKQNTRNIPAIVETKSVFLIPKHFNRILCKPSNHLQQNNGCSVKILSLSRYVRIFLLRGLLFFSENNFLCQGVITTNIFFLLIYLE